MNHEKILWRDAPKMNTRWIRVTMKNGENYDYNADYVDHVEYFEND